MCFSVLYVYLSQIALTSTILTDFIPSRWRSFRTTDHSDLHINFFLGEYLGLGNMTDPCMAEMFVLVFTNEVLFWSLVEVRQKDALIK